MEKYICFATLSTGSKIKLTEEIYNRFMEADNDDFIQLPSGTTFKKSAVMEVQDINEWVDEKHEYSYGQAYTPLPPPLGFTGIISSAKRLSALEAMARGLKKAKAKFEAQGRTTKNIDGLLEMARTRYAQIKKV